MPYSIAKLFDFLIDMRNFNQNTLTLTLEIEKQKCVVSFGIQYRLYTPYPRVVTRDIANHPKSFRCLGNCGISLRQNFLFMDIWEFWKKERKKRGDNSGTPQQGLNKLITFTSSLYIDHVYQVSFRRVESAWPTSHLTDHLLTPVYTNNFSSWGVK